MNTTQKQHNWSEFINFFSRQNKDRPTRIGVFTGQPGSRTDYWLEDGLPLQGIDIEQRDGQAPIVEILLGEAEKSNSRAFTHTVFKTRSIKIILSADGTSDGLEIEDEEGSVTILRFETETMTAHL